MRGLPGNRPSGYAKVSPCGDLCTTPPVLGVRPVLLPLLRVGVRGLPATVPRVTQRWAWVVEDRSATRPRPRLVRAAANPSPGGEGWGEGSSGQPSPGLRKGLPLRRPLHNSPRPRRCGRSCSLSWGERVGVRGLPGNRPSGYAKVSPRGGAAADLGRRPAGQGPQHGRPRGLSGSPAEPPAGRHSLSHGWRMREPMACWIRPPAKVRGGPSAAVVTTL